MIKYLELGDVSDGRTAIDAFTLPAIANDPIFGYGIETFSKVSGELANRSWPYPHQYIYQYLFEGGIVFWTYSGIFKPFADGKGCMHKNQR